MARLPGDRLLGQLSVVAALEPARAGRRDRRDPATAIDAGSPANDGAPVKPDAPLSAPRVPLIGLGDSALPRRRGDDADPPGPG